MAGHDHILINMSVGPVRILFDDLEFDWPPPERLYMDRTDGLREAIEGDEAAFIFKRIRMSELTDEQMLTCSQIARGAEYVYEQMN